jgi:hypothetical protein
MLSSSPSKITNHSSPACPRDPRTSDSARKLRNTRGTGQLCDSRAPPHRRNTKSLDTESDSAHLLSKFFVESCALSPGLPIMR